MLSKQPLITIELNYFSSFILKNHQYLRPILLQCFLQYFHPDNMSSAEKLKIELAKVRDEFKMSDSDCGSARVQGEVY